MLFEFMEYAVNLSTRLQKKDLVIFHCAQKRYFFTFVEVLVALAILGFSLTIILQIVATARGRLIRARRTWSRQHVVAQILEHSLLAGPDSTVPENIIPEGYSAEVERDNRWQGELLSEPEPVNGWILQRITIRIFDDAGNAIGKGSAETLVHEDDL